MNCPCAEIFILHRVTIRPYIYSGGLNNEHGNTYHMEYQHFEARISNGSVLEWSVIAIAIAMALTILEPNHGKSEQNGCHFVLISNGLGQNGAILFIF